MSGAIVDTPLGRFRSPFARPERITDRPFEDVWLFECPGCGQWAYLDVDQWHGRVSVDHSADGCSGGYHEMHDYFAMLARFTSRREERR